VHLYPEKGKGAEATATLQLFQELGKPVLVEETFPLKVTGSEFVAFLDACDQAECGVLGFFWGQIPEELTPPKSIADAILREWLQTFAQRAGARQR